MHIKRSCSMIAIVSLIAIFSSGSAFAVTIGIMPGTDTGYAGSVVSDLQGLGVFSKVDQLNGSETLATLESYNAILFYTNYASDLSSIGNKLADYVDAGGGLVTATFVYQTIGIGYGYDAGRLQSGGYLPFYGYYGDYSTASLGSFDASNPIMSSPFDITSLNGYYRDLVSLSPGATLVASWSDGWPLVAVSSSNVVGITLFPDASYGNVSGDYDQLFANALLYAAGQEQPATVPEPTSLLLLGSGLAGIGIAAWRRRK